MQTWHIVVIVVAVFGLIIGNIALIRHSAKMEFKKPDTPQEDIKKP
jgi:nitrogen fixation protein FixH